MFVGLLALLIWAAVGKLDQVTRAQAQVVAEARTQVIQSPDGGVLTELHVKEGDKVKAGQTLATLQKERAEAAVSETKAKVAALRITLVRLQAEVYGRPLTFDSDLRTYPEYISNQTDLYKKRQQAFHEDINALKKILDLSESELKINLKLEASGDVSKTEVLRLERSVADVRAQLAGKKNKYLQDAQAEMTKAQEDLSTHATTAYGNIMTYDLAAETTALAAAQTKENGAMAMLAQANVSQELVAYLLKKYIN
jgi:adhesin transport system membrane fusion protein